LLVTVFLGLAFLPFLLLLGGTVHFGFLSLGLELHGSALWLEGVFGWAYCAFIDLNLPTLTLQFRLNEQVLASSTLALSEASQQTTPQMESSQPISSSTPPLHPSLSSSVEFTPMKNSDLALDGTSIRTLQQEPPGDRTLLCVHGYTGSSVQFDDFLTNPDLGAFYNNIVAVDYYKDNDHYGHRILEEYGDVNIPIAEIGDALVAYILGHPETFHTTIDIVAHSMGGLVVREMIKYRYLDLVAAGYRIDDVALIATPNHGTWISEFPLFLLGLVTVVSAILFYLDRVIGGLAVIIGGVLISIFLAFLIGFIGGTQGEQMNVILNRTLTTLNSPDETPYGVDDEDDLYKHISWSTYRGNKGIWIQPKPPFFGSSWLFVIINPFIYFEGGEDGLVHCSSVPLNGAHNYGPFIRDHNELLDLNTIISDNFFEKIYTELTT
ncbi:MAG: hypothetical protein EU536_05080, partial [Promethearchaeota archaeon]